MLGSYTKPWNCVNQLGAVVVVLDMVDVGSVVLEANCTTVRGVDAVLGNVSVRRPSGRGREIL
jgi:hypothetical protein